MHDDLIVRLFDAGLLIIAAVLYRPLASLVSGHRELDACFYRETDLEGRELSRHLAELDRGLGGRWLRPLVLTLLLGLGGSLTSWDGLDGHAVLRPLILCWAGLVVWKGVTLDVDLATNERKTIPRLVALAAWAGLWLHPACLVILLFVAVNELRGWYHHQYALIRSLHMFLVVVIVRLLIGLPMQVLAPMFEPPRAVVLTAMLMMLVSHYVVPGVSKLRLGRRWWSWMAENRLHHLAVSAYLWGWLPRVSDKTVIAWARRIAPFDRLLQVAVVGIELMAMTVATDRWVAVGVLVVLAGFHLGVFLLSGLLFWQSSVGCAVLAILLIVRGAPLADTAFGVVPGLVCALVLLVGPVRGRLWRPSTLAWWDTPFTGRIHWRVVGQSGRVYELHNGFLCPNERQFGKGEFRSDEPCLTGHLGELRNGAVLAAIRDSGGDPDALAALECEHGGSGLSVDAAASVDDYLRRVLRGHNRGLRKRVCPAWLKAPGGMFFRWGDLPSFVGQEPVTKIVVYSKKAFFDGERIRVLYDVPLRSIDL